MSDSGDELLIEIEDDAPPNFTPEPEVPVDQMAVDAFTHVLQTFKVVMPDVPIEFTATGETRLSLSSDFLPLSLRAVYSFNITTPAGDLSDLLHIDIALANFRWDARPTRLTARHPMLDVSYVGFPLVQAVLGQFFSGSYHPKAHYRSQTCLLVPTGTARLDDVEVLAQNGFDRRRAARACSLRQRHCECGCLFEYRSGSDTHSSNHSRLHRVSVALPCA
jgi:hypothetical protein